MRLVLASASIRRSDLLQKMGLEFEVVPSGADEELDDIKCPQNLAMLLATKKAKAVFDLLPCDEEVVVLGADTIVVCDGVVLGKPSGKEQAIDMLMGLSGRTHEVITGICLYSAHRVVSSLDKSEVSFVDFGTGDIIGYIESGKSFDKAGGYGIQDDEIAKLTKSVSGSLNNIIGLPTELVTKILGEHF